MILHNAPPTHGQVLFVATLLPLIVLFIAVMTIAFLTAVRRDRARTVEAEQVEEVPAA